MNKPCEPKQTSRYSIVWPKAQVMIDIRSENKLIVTEQWECLRASEMEDHRVIILPVI